MNEQAITEEPQAKTFIDRDSLIKRRYREGEVTTSLERTFKIKAIDPKTLLITKGSSFLPAFNDFLEDPSPSNVGDPEILGFITQVVILAVTSINFVDKTVDECEGDETPIEVLDIDEQIEVFSAIMELCSTEEEQKEWNFFRDELEEDPTD
jgi:hypothetical protein